MQDAAASCIMRWCSSAASRCDRFHGVAEGAPGGTRSAYYEEVFFADSERYTAYLDTTQTGRGRRRRTTTVSSSGLNFDPSTGVSVPLIAVGPGYWSATVTHTQISNFSCGIGVNTVNPVDATASDGASVCK